MNDVASKRFVLACTLVVMLVLHFAPRGPFAGPTGASAGSTSTLSNLGAPRAKQPHVGMLNRPANQDGCKGAASLTLAYSATGTLEQ